MRTLLGFVVMMFVFFLGTQAGNIAFTMLLWIASFWLFAIIAGGGSGDSSWMGDDTGDF